jgi:selenide,water dikinase
MGAKPLAALNILAFPRSLGTAVVKEVLRGGADKVAEAGAFLMGGHSIDDDEPKYGLAVFGTATPTGIVRNAGAQAGDCLFYTKRIGTGIMAAALRTGLITEEQMRPAIDSMMELNRAASEAMLAAGAHAATDVTGFGLAGHLHEMLAASGVAAQLEWDAIPLFDGVYELSADYCRPGKTFDIIEWARPFLRLSTVDSEQADARLGVICDPQTSGGLIVAVAPEQADGFVAGFARLCGREPALIGKVTTGVAGMITL